MIFGRNINAEQAGLFEMESLGCNMYRHSDPMTKDLWSSVDVAVWEVHG